MSWFLSVLSISSVQAADKIDLIIDTDPGADDVVALLLALASPEQLNVLGITTAGKLPGQNCAMHVLPGSGLVVKRFPSMPGLQNPWCARLSTPRTFMVRKVLRVFRCTSLRKGLSSQ